MLCADMVLAGLYGFVFQTQNELEDYTWVPPHIIVISLGSIHDGKGGEAVILVSNLVFILFISESQ